ncbi:MAG: tRNA (adenosine(37)-N6)-threonylcarbamoyltransferase complex transferase subunit TsaD [Candidatus Omnitrophica bacterium]|nr:tRNA (adenosine(37)-N6)-threonylcarbamoyltransferase complex transferase subunit TsaD [Candidatus Omnitrophota bacterium]
MLVLGIETSCDETAVSVVENGKRILSNEVLSSLHLHKKYGGVVPEIATRHHVELINYVLRAALGKAKVKLSGIDLIAAVHGPGLVGALLIGLSLAKVLSLALNAPLVGINHLQAHLYAALMLKRRPQFPFVGLVVSGGHTNLFYVRDYLIWETLGRTRDDAAGEAFDKVAKILNLGYPGGPVIEKMAKCGRPDKIRFPRSCLEENSLDFSFSGLKTAVLYYVRDSFGRRASKKSIRNTKIADVAASFQEAAVDTLAEKAIKACLLKGVKNFVAGGGVVANRRLREVLRRRLNRRGIDTYFPKFGLCQDNAAMVAGLGYQQYLRGIVSNLNLEAQPNLTIVPKRKRKK